MIVAAALFTVIVTLIIVAATNSRGKRRNPPGPRGLPVVGNLLQLDSSKPHIYLYNLSRDYGPLLSLNHASTPVLVVSSSKLAKHVLKTHDLSFCTRPPVLGQQKLSYNGADMAFSPFNSHWKDTRRMCVLHLFSPKQVLSFRPIREAQVGRMMSKISGAAAVNLSQMAMSLASNIICGVAFGRTYEDEEYEKKKLDRMVLEAQALMVSFYFCDHLGWLSWVDGARGLLGRLETNFEEMDAFYEQLIQEHLEPNRDHGEDDIIDIIIQLKRHNPQSITWDHIKALLMNLFVAGTDTAAALIVWTMTALMLNSRVMKKVQSHIRQTIRQKGFINEDDIDNLPYLKAVVLESLRLYPPAPLLYRTPVDHQTTPSSSLHIDGYQIKPESKLIINAWAIARDPETWEDPLDFVPERFMNSDGSGVKIYSEFEMIPFGGGRRGCPGGVMGLVSAELALANLLYSFDWVLPSLTSINTEALPGLTMHKKDPLLLCPIHYLPSS